MSALGSDRLLLLGALLGAGLAAFDLVGRPSSPKAPDQGALIARVNGEPVLRADYERALAAVSAELKGRADPELEAHVLERLIDEMLLVQRGLQLGLVSRDPYLRTVLSQAVLDTVIAKARGAPPSLERLERFYAENASYFARPVRLLIERAYEGPAAPLLPEGWVSQATLARFLSPTAAKTLLASPKGATLELVAGLEPGRYKITIKDIEAGRPPFEEIKALVQQEHQRRLEEQAVRDFLAQRRAAAQIEVYR